MKTRLSVVLAFLFGTLTACGGGSGGGASRDGLFVDAAVSGLRYASNSRNGLTGADGGFRYRGREQVSFQIGGIDLGSAAGKPVLSPLDLAGAADETDARATNIARVLQTLDDDGDPANGILISQAVRDAAAGLTLDFSLGVTAFAGDPNTASVVAVLTGATALGARSLVAVADARAHLRATLLGLLAGVYRGTFEGDRAGTWSVTIGTDGVITGTGISGSDAFGISGSVLGSGQASLSAGFDGGATFSGTVSFDGNFSGTWQGDSENGTFSAESD